MHDSLSGLFRKEKNERLLREFGETLVKLIDTAGSVHQFHLTREERVTVSGDFQLHEGILFTVFPSDGFFGVGAGFTDECVVRRNIFEYNGTVAGRMDIFFHDLFCRKWCQNLNFSKIEAQRYARKHVLPRKH